MSALKTLACGRGAESARERAEEDEHGRQQGVGPPAPPPRRDHAEQRADREADDERAAGEEHGPQERGADDRIVLAKDVGPRHRKTDAVQCLDHLELAVDRVRRLDEFARRFAAQNVVARRRGQKIGRIRLTALELFDGQRTFEIGDRACQVLREARFVEAMATGMPVIARRSNRSGCDARRRPALCERMPPGKPLWR